eukprot:TRINITY_DN12258_c0_g1_i1.p2 TRINITY_DN12258_c0_g1~~TRINITY_DN12258_c0_g1_i1.p2  ORF type:complete len:400 (+),score=64.20 TRINITY_DN12258_c0_g1_i1:1665-2864(+)
MPTENSTFGPSLARLCLLVLFMAVASDTQLADVTAAAVVQWSPPATLGSGQRVAVAVDFSDRVHYAWWDNQDSTVVYCTAGRTTPTKCDEQPVKLPASGPSSNPSIAVDVTGRPHVAWETRENGTEHYSVYYSTLGSANASDWHTQRITDASVLYSELPSIGVTPANPPVVHVVFQTHMGDEGSGEVYRVTSLDGGATWGTPTTVAPGYFPRLHVDARCCVHLVYNAPPPYGVFYVNQSDCRCVDAEGTFGAPLLVSSGHREQTPDVATWTTQTGTEAVVVWGDYQPSFSMALATINDGRRTYLRRNADGGLGYSLMPRIATNAAGRFLIGFQGKNYLSQMWSIYAIGFNATTQQFTGYQQIASTQGDQMQVAAPALRVADAIIAFADTTAAKVEVSYG